MAARDGSGGLLMRQVRAHVASPFGAAGRPVAVPLRASVAEAAALAKVGPGALAYVGGAFVPAAAWSRVRLKADVFFTFPPRGNTFRTVALIAAAAAISFAAPGAGLAFAGAIGFGAASTAAAIGSVAFSIAAGLAVNLAMNALFPPARPRAPDLSGARPLESINSTRNVARVGEPVPVILGKVRWAPDLAAVPRTFIQGGDQFVQMAFCHGVGPLAISSVRVGTTPLSAFEDVAAAHIGDFEAAAHPLYNLDVVEEALSVALLKDEAVSRFTAADTRAAGLQIVAPAGLYGIRRGSAALANNPARLRIRYRLDGAGAWTVSDLPEAARTINGLRNEPRRVQFRIVFPSAGRWQVELMRETDEGADPKVSDWVKTLTWAGLVSQQAGRPFNPDRPLAMSFIQARATGQLSGALDTVSAVVESIGKAWNGSAWVDGQKSENPADLFRLALQHPALARKAADAEIDLAQLQAWHGYCAAKGWKYGRRIDAGESVREVLSEIAAAGRAVYAFRAGRHSVVFDEEDAGPRHLLHPANSSGFAVRRVYPDPPQAFRVPFLDRTQEFSLQERTVYADGFNAGNATLVERLELPGVTDPVQVRKFARYALAEVTLRREEATVLADWGAVELAHGDRVSVAHDVISVGLAFGRIAAVDALAVTLDQEVEIEAGKVYALLWRTGGSEAPVTRLLTTGAGTHRTVALTAPVLALVPPVAGLGFVFGEADRISEVWRVRRKQRRSEGTVELTLVRDAPEIYLADSEAIPVWEPRLSTAADPRDYAPTGATITETVEAGTGGAKTITEIVWSPPPFGEVVQTAIRWRRPGGAAELIATVAGGESRVRLEGLPPGFNEFSISSAFAGFAGWSKALTASASLQAETRRPAAPTGARLKADGATATISVDPPSEPWQARLAVRRSTAGSPSWETATPLVETAGHVAAVPAMPGTYLLKWLSPFGIYSAGSASLVSGLGALASVNVVETQDEAPDWAGTKTDMTAAAGDLSLDEEALAGSYRTQLPDLGAVFTSRVTVELSGGGFARGDEVADWPAVELIEEVTGVTDAEWSLALSIRTTPDDPAGAPAWSDWRPFEAGDYTFRGAELRLDAEVTSPLVGILLSEFETVIDMPDRIESAGGVSVGSGGLAVSYGRAFRAVRGVVLQVVGGAAGDYAEPSSEAVTGFTATVRSAAGSAKAGTINWQATGYGAV